MKHDNIQTEVTRSLQKMRVRNSSIIEGRSDGWIRQDVGLILDEVIEKISAVQDTICGRVWQNYLQEKRGKSVKVSR